MNAARNTDRNWRASLLGLGTITALTLLTTPAPAQGPGGPPDGMGRPPFDRPMDGGQGRPPFGGPRPISLANVPLSALAAGLNLKGDQLDGIARLKQQARSKRQDAPGPPSQASEQAATGAITGILTDTQKSALSGLIQTFRALQAAGIPLTLYADLKLTASQSAQIKALASSDTAPPLGREARQQAREKVTALLTDTQKEMVEEARDEARMMGGPPPPQFGGRMGRPGQGGGPGGERGNDRRGGPPSGGPGDDLGGGPPPPRDGGGPDGQMGGPPPGGPGGPPDGF